MLIASIFIYSIFYSVKNKSFIYFCLFQVIILIAIGIFFFNNIEAAFQIDLTKPSDTALYYEGFKSSFKNIDQILFYQYPLFLKILAYPFNITLIAIYGQCILVFFFLDIIIKIKSNLLLFIFNHTLIFTITNLFKDNFILITALFTFILLKRIKNTLLQSVITAISFTVIAWVRTFFYMLIPIAFFPLISYVKSKKVKFLICIGIIGVIISIIIINLPLIQYVIDNWATDESVQDEKSSPLIAIIKIFLGPTPLHYLFHSRYFVQPLLDSLGFYFCILHIIYYITFTYVMIFVYSNWKNLFVGILHKNPARIYMLLNGTFLLAVYTLAYGSADIRQRALIITFLYLYILSDKSIVFQKISGKKTIVAAIIFLSTMVITFLS